MQSNTVNISPVQIWTSSGIKTATLFRVSSVQYNGGPVTATCHLLSSEEEYIVTQIVSATAEQTANWNDDLSFYAVLAQNTGLTVV